MRTLQFDSGNTRLKWLLREGSNEHRSGFFSNADDWNDVLPPFLATVGRVDLVSISTVTASERLEHIKKQVQNTLRVPVYIAESKKNCAGVTLSYEHPEKFGVDRWLAMLAAHALQTNDSKVVVNCGTGTTIDVLDANGHHLGGYIVPGIGLMKKTLASNTARLSLFESEDVGLALGNTTQDCIQHGVMAMTVALVDRVVGEHPGSRVILSGGDGKLIEQSLSVYKAGRVALRPNLVLDGLDIAARKVMDECAG